MKRVFFIISLLCIGSLLSTSAVAVVKATPTASASATPKAASVQSKIDDLKERLATKVAELRKTAPKALFGTVTGVTVSTITVDLGGKAIRIELTDDIKVAQILKGKRTVLTIDKVEKNDPVTVFGDYDSTLDLLKAKQIFIEDAVIPTRIQGTITSVDKTNFNFTIKATDGQTYTIEVETTTKSNIWTKGGTLEKAGFSKITEGMFVSVLGLEDAKKTNTISATRTLLVSLTAPTPTPTKEVTPTPSKKVTITPTPTKKAATTPTPTP